MQYVVVQCLGLRSRPAASSVIVGLVCLAMGASLAVTVSAQEKGAPKTDDLLDLLDEVSGGPKKADLDRIAASHLSPIRSWQGVRPATAKPTDTPKYSWGLAEGFVVPLGDQKISTLIQVPSAGKYRVYLRHVLTQDEARPVTLRFEPMEKGAGLEQKHIYGALKLDAAKNGKELEAELPIRMESELHLNTFPGAKMPVWEFWDIDLGQGAWRASLESTRKNVQVDSLFLTQSTSFRPSYSEIAKDNSLQRVLLRVRTAAQASKKAPKTGVSAGLTYHWRGRSTRAGVEMWGCDIGAAQDIVAGEWSPFLDATDAVVRGPGPWSTCRVGLSGVPAGPIEIQFAWYPHPAAVVHELKTACDGKQAMLRIPNGSPAFATEDAQPRWGLWNAEFVKGIAAEEQLVERYFQWASEAAVSLGLAENHPRPEHLLFLSSCRVGAAHRERATAMLARLGINWIEGASKETISQLGLYDGSRMTKIKNGDEIGTRTPASVINGSPRLLAEFHQYLMAQSTLEETPIETLLGVPNLDRIRCLERMPDNPGRYERRLYYHSHRYAHLATLHPYFKSVRDAEAQFKNAAVYNNYSPHPVFLTGNTMNEGDWFLLARRGAQTLGWGEDWAYPGSWALGTDRAQCVSFYAALVDCSVRKRGYPAGFYVGSNTGNSANKIFSCVAQGVHLMHLYDWGPIDAWAEGSNAWSEHEGEYKSVLMGTHALGPADEIIAHGQREPRRTAILYNRAHEIMNGSTVSLNHDWMWAYIAMKSAQIPVDVILEEDLTRVELAKYRALYLGGLNLESRHLRVVADWVREGGLLMGTGGSASLDAYNDSNPLAVELFGARQIPVSEVDPGRADQDVTFTASEWFPAAKFAASGTRIRYELMEQSTGSAVRTASYSSGNAACVTQALGKGRTILFGFYPGYVFRDTGRALGPNRAWFIQPLLAHLGRQKVEFSFPASEATLFEHKSGLAVTLANFGPAGAKLPTERTLLSVATDRPIREVTSALRGKLEWKRVGDRIEIQGPAPADLVVDTILLK